MLFLSIRSLELCFQFTGVSYIEGGRTASGFYTVEEVEHPTRLYRVSIRNSNVRLDPVSV